MLSKLKSSFPSYTFSLLSTVLALLVTSQVDVLRYRTPFALFYAAVVASTWYGGRNPGLVAIALSALATDYFIIPPLYSIRPDSINLLEESVFIAVALLITSLASAHQRGERSRRESEERYRIITETASDAIITIDETSRVLFVNHAAEKIFGHSENEMIGRSLTLLMPDYLRHVHEAGIKRYLDTGQKHLNWKSIELPGLHKDGHQISLEVSFGEFKKNGEHNFTGIVRDVSERKRTQEERERFFALGADLLVIASFDGHFKWASPAWQRALGWSLEEIISHPWLYFVHPEDQEKTIKEAEKLFQGVETVSFENRYRHKNGSYRWISWNARPYREEQLLYCAASDVTERKELEEQLRQSQKLESIGLLAGGVAHDFNNLLTVIMGYSSIGLSRIAPDDPLRRNLEEINQAAERASSLTRQLLAFSRKQILQPKVLDLTSTVSNMDKMLRRLIGEDIQLVTVLDPKLQRVKVDPGQVEQILMNLAVNARDAMPKGGKLTVETKNVVLDSAYSRRHGNVIPGPYVMLALSDTGAGMDSQTQARIFEPFFTTKGPGKGTGLGLAMVYGIVKQSGGNIWVYSEPGHGTTFKIYLPTVEDEAEAIHESSLMFERKKGTETILLVEDEDAVRMLLLDILQVEGYTVLQASNGYEALEICEEYSDPIHLLMTDVVMPGMSGSQLVERLTANCRDVKVLYMSGYTDDAIVHHGVLDPGVAFLQKPFTPNGVAEKVREVLESNVSS